MGRCTKLGSKNLLLKTSNWGPILPVLQKHKMPHPGIFPEFQNSFRVYCRSVIAVANDLILVELDGGQYSLFYNPHNPLLVLISTKVWGGISWLVCLMVLGILIPMSGKDFTDRPLSVLLLDWALLTIASRPPVLLVWYGPRNGSLLLLLPLSIVNTITITDLIELYIWAIVPSRLVIFIGGSITCLVTQETIL